MKASWLHRLRFGRPPSRHELVLGLLLLITVGLRVAWLTYVNVDPNERVDDSVFYHRAAEALAGGGGYDDPWTGRPTAQWPPAYPAVLALAYLPPGQNLLAGKALNVALALAGVLLTYLVASRLFSRRAGLLAALVLAVFPSYVYLSTLIFSENLFVPAFLLVLLLVVRWGLADRQPTALQSLAVGAVIAFSALVRAEGIWLLGPALVVWLVAARGRATATRNAVLVLAGTAVLLAPWTVRNALQLHEFAPVRSGASASLGVGLSPDYEQYGPVPPPVPLPTVGDDLRFYLERPWHVFVLLGKKAYDLYENDHDIVYWVHWVALGPAAYRRWQDVADAAYYGFGAVALGGLTLLLLARHRGALFLGGVILTWTLGMALIIPEPRYHFALLPLLSILASVVATQSSGVFGESGFLRGRGPQVATSMLAVGAVIAAVTIGLGFDDGVPRAPYQAPVALAARVGETLNLGELEVTVRDFSPQRGEDGMPVPRPGYVWLVVDATVRNVGTAEALLFDAQAVVEDADGNLYLPQAALPVTRSLDGSLRPGETLQGSVVYAVPADAPHLEFVFTLLGVAVEGRWVLE